MNVKIVDTTLRDGEQKAGIALGINEKMQIAALLDKAGVYQIEAGIPAMGGSEKLSVMKIVDMNLNCKIAAWNRISISDIKHSIDCKPDIIHISAPASDIQIRSKLGKDRNWVVENLKRCISLAKENGFYVTVGLEDASRADFAFLLELVNAAFLNGVKRIRYADTVGILHAMRIYAEVTRLRMQIPVDIEMHAHNDFGMAVSNTISAAEAGAAYVDCTIGGLGERAGNCNYVDFVRVAKETLGLFEDINMEEVIEIQKNILDIMMSQKTA